MTLKGLQNTTYRVTGAPIGSGGEGEIFRVSGGGPGLGGGGGKVAKLYRPEAVSRELEEKLILMVQNPPKASVLTQVAWPLDVVYEGGAFRGFIMQELSINAELGDVYKYPPVLPLSTRQKVTIAQNICAVISEVHKAGYVFGDFNPRNIGLDKNTGYVSFLDTDTYHVAAPESGKTYRCNVCAPGYAAPELLEKCSNFAAQNPTASKHAYAQTPLPTFTKETDNFALAIHIFKLLMNGYTPFGGIIETASVSQASPGVGDAAVRRDNYCFKPGFKHQSAAILPLETFPQEIADLFTKAFIAGRHDSRLRPSAVQWHGALVRFLQNLKGCDYNSLHQYDNKNAVCPLCEADRRYGAAVGAGAGAPISQSSYSAYSGQPHMPHVSAGGAMPPYGPHVSAGGAVPPQPIYTSSQAGNPQPGSALKKFFVVIAAIAGIAAIAFGLPALISPQGGSAPDNRPGSAAHQNYSPGQTTPGAQTASPAQDTETHEPPSPPPPPPPAQTPPPAQPPPPPPAAQPAQPTTPAPAAQPEQTPPPPPPPEPPPTPAPFGDIIGWSATSFAGASDNRAHNIIHTAGFVNGMVLQPGQTFSFNTTVGERTSGRGFRRAEGMLDGQRTYAIGGGVSQVASTIFDAVLVAGLEVVERHQHGAEVDFIPLGRDAHVAWGANLDLRFRNSSSSAIRIDISTAFSELTVTIMGTW